MATTQKPEEPEYEDRKHHALLFAPCPYTLHAMP